MKKKKTEEMNNAHTCTAIYIYIVSGLSILSKDKYYIHSSLYYEKENKILMKLPHYIDI